MIQNVSCGILAFVALVIQLDDQRDASFGWNCIRKHGCKIQLQWTIKDMEPVFTRIDHIIFGPIGKDLDKVMDITKQLSKFAR